MMSSSTVYDETLLLVMGYWLNVPFIQPTEDISVKFKDIHWAGVSYNVYKSWGNKPEPLHACTRY